MLKIFILSIAIFHTASADARWALPEEAVGERIQERVEIEVAGDGTFITRLERADLVLKEPARQEMGIIATNYNSQTSKLRVIEAFTKNGNNIIKVAPEFIQDKPLASTLNGFDQINQVLIAFPQVDIGSQLHLKLETNYSVAPFPGFFSTTFVYGYNRSEKSSSTLIRSKLPLFIEVNDPKKHLEVKNWKENKEHFISIRLKRPIFIKPMEEHRSSIDESSFPWVDISSAKDWKDMVKPVLPEYEARLAVELPKAFTNILRKAEKISGATEKINFVTSELAEVMHYLGDWRPINGGYIPRPLSTIASTRFGDCKDFSLATTAILRKLGFEANIALIMRGIDPLLSPNKLPNVTAFNHAIVWARDKDREYWIDPTNPTSFSQGILEDISDRPALILHPTNPVYTRTPQPQPSEAIYHFEIAKQAQGNNKFAAKGKALYGGRAALLFTGAELGDSKKTIDYKIISFMGDVQRMHDWKVGPYNLNSRIVSNLEFQFSFTEEIHGFRTSAGNGLNLELGWLLAGLLVETKDRVTDLYLGLPYDFQRKVEISRISILGSHDLSCKAESPWADIERKYQKTEAGIRVVDRVQLKSSRIRAKEISSPAYANFQRELRSCFEGSGAIYELKQGS